MNHSMFTKQFVVVLAVIAGLLLFSACNKNAPAAQDAQDAEALPPVEESVSRQYVEGVAGGVMVQNIDLVGTVTAVDQERRTATLKGPEGNEVIVYVGEGAVNFYQIEVGDKVNVSIARELVIYVNEDAETEAQYDGVSGVVATAPKGEAPEGAVVATKQVTGKINAMDLEQRSAEIAFADGATESFNIRPDVDMTRYEVGQEVVFLITEMLALSVEKI